LRPPAYCYLGSMNAFALASDGIALTLLLALLFLLIFDSIDRYAANPDSQDDQGENSDC
jgi:hypothetical protein